MTLPSFLPFELPGDFDELVALAERIENRAESGQRTHELFTRCRRLLGWFDVHGAQSANGVAAELGYLVQSDVLQPLGLSDAQLLELVRWLVVPAERTSGPRAEHGQEAYVRRVLKVELAQGSLHDLLYFPREELSPDRFLNVARLQGEDLRPFLSVDCEPRSFTTQPQAPWLAKSRALLAELARDGHIFLSLGETCAHSLALTLPTLESGLGDWLVDADGIAEVLADDATLDAALSKAR